MRQFWTLPFVSLSLLSLIHYQYFYCSFSFHTLSKTHTVVHSLLQQHESSHTNEYEDWIHPSTTTAENGSQLDLVPSFLPL